MLQTFVISVFDEHLRMRLSMFTHSSISIWLFRVDFSGTCPLYSWLTWIFQSTICDYRGSCLSQRIVGTANVDKAEIGPWWNGTKGEKVNMIPDLRSRRDFSDYQPHLSLCSGCLSQSQPEVTLCTTERYAFHDENLVNPARFKNSIRAAAQVWLNAARGSWRAWVEIAYWPSLSFQIIFFPWSSRVLLSTRRRLDLSVLWN